MPYYFMLKEKISLDENVDIDSIFSEIMSTYNEKELDTRDGIKINKKSGWIHLRKSNTEPIIRIYIEAKNKEESEMFFSEIKKIIDTNS
jgi:phosphomannomutase